MTLINIPGFSGLNILAAPQRIREDEATLAIGCDFRSLDLRAFRGDAESGQGTVYTSGLSNGASIYQFDDSHWLGVAGDKSFARSPTFYSDGSTGQRVFIADNAAPAGTEWDWVREATVSDMVSAGYPASYQLTGAALRLGVPRPTNTTKLDYEQKQGRVTYLERFTDADTLITVSNPEYVKAGNKLILDVPGIGAGAFTVSKKSDVTPYKLTLRGERLAYMQVVAKKKNNSTELKFYKPNHGFVGGEQVILNKRSGVSGGFESKLPAALIGSNGYNEVLFAVAWVSLDEFKLTYGEASTELALTANAGETADEPMKVALVAAVDDTIANAWLSTQVIVNVQGSGGRQQKLTYNGLQTDTEVTSTWEIASEELMARSYCVTFVNSYGDESEPSDPTETITVAQGDPVTLSLLPTTAASYAEYKTGNDVPTIAKYRTPSHLRVYRTDATGQFRLLTTEVDSGREITWAEASGSGFTLVDTYPDSELGEPLSTEGWRIPPKDLNGLLVTPGGALVGYAGRGVLGSVPYAPYAFPLANRVACDYDVMGLVATSAGVVVVTEGMPSLIVGDNPATWSVQKLEYPYGCVSRRSIVDMGEMAIYASADGLVGIAGAAVEILTKNTMTRAQWQSLYNPSEIFAAHVEGRYYGVTVVGGSRKAFMFDPRTQTFIDLTVDAAKYPVALYSRLDTDTLLILKSDGKVYHWNRGTDWVPYTWRSKYFQLTRPDILGCAQVVAPALLGNFAMTLRLLAWDGEAVVTVALYSNLTGADFTALGAADFTTWENGKVRKYVFDKNVNPFRLPVPDNRYTVYQVELTGTLPIGQVTLASVIDELKQA